MNFRDTIGHAIEAAATGAVGVATSLMSYIKQIVTQVGDAGTGDTNVNTSLHEIKHKDASHTFSATTDSLEAIRDELDSATYGLSNIHTHVDDIDTDLGEPGTGDTSVNSSLHDIRHKDVNHTYSATTDSLEAIRDSLGTPAGASVSADIAGVKAETASILAAVSTEVADILTDTGTTIPGTITTLQSDVTTVKTQTDKLASAALVAAASASTNWNTGTGTSTEAGADLVTIGGAGVKQKLVKLLINIANVTTGSIVEVRAYDSANSVAGKRLAYSQVRTTPAQGTTPDIVDIIAQTGGAIELDNAMRIELYSSANEAKVINYEYRLELR